MEITKVINTGVFFDAFNNPHEIVEPSWKKDEVESICCKSQLMPRLEIANIKLALYGLKTLQFGEVSFLRGWNNCYYSEYEVIKIENEIEEIEKIEEKETEIRVARETFRPMYEKLVDRAKGLGFVMSFSDKKIEIQHGNYYYAKFYNNIDLSKFIEELKQEERAITIKNNNSNVA